MITGRINNKMIGQNEELMIQELRKMVLWRETGQKLSGELVCST